MAGVTMILKHNFNWLKRKQEIIGSTGVIFGFFFIAAILVFVPAIFRPSIFQVFGGDVYHNLWIWGRNVSNVMAGVAPYTPNIFFPDPMSSFYSEMEIGHSILYGLFTLIGLHPIQSYLTIVILSFALTGIMVALISRRLGASTGGAIIGGSIAAFASYRYNHLAHIQVLSTFWMLLPLYFSLSYLMAGRSRDLFFVFLMHIPILCGPSYNLIGLILLESAIFLVFVFASALDIKTRWLRVKYWVLAIAVAVLLTTPFWLSYFKLFLGGLERSASDHAAYAMNLLSFITPPGGSIFYSEFLNTTISEGRGTFSANSIFMGFVATFFLVMAIFRRLTPLQVVQPGKTVDPLPFVQAIKWTGIIFLLFSLGNVITWGNTHLLPNPVFWLGDKSHLLSATRYIAHYAYFGFVALSIVVAYQISYVAPNFKLFKRIFIQIGLAILIIFESRVSIAPNASTLPSQLSGVPRVYVELAKLPPGSGLIFLPLPTVVSNSDVSFQRQFEYMYYAQYHRLAMFNGISGFFPPHYTQGVGLLSEFPNLSGLNFILKNHIDYVVYDKHSGRPMDFSKEKIDSVCASSLTSIYADADYELFQVDRARGMECVTKAGSSALAQWIFLASTATPHQIGHFNNSVMAMVSNPGDQGALAFGPYIVLGKGKYRASFSIKATAQREGIEVGALDVNGYSDKIPNRLYNRIPIHAGSRKQELQIEFEVVDPSLKHEFRVWSNGAGTIELFKISIEKL